MMCGYKHFMIIPYFVFAGTYRRSSYNGLQLIQAHELENPISYGHAMSFLMHVVDHVFDTMLPFHSLLSARVSEFGFFHPMS